MKNENFKPFDYFNGANFTANEDVALLLKSVALIEYMRNEMRQAMRLRDRNDEEQYYRSKFENEIEPKIIELENVIRDAVWEDVTMNLGDEVNVKKETILI